jgi:hypothetical protein
MATVYLAEDLKHERKVAVKVLRPVLAAVLGGDRFNREIHIAAQRDRFYFTVGDRQSDIWVTEVERP